MANVPAALRLRTATVSVGADEYTAHIQDFDYRPNTPTSEVTDVSGKVVKFAGEAGYDLVLNVFQDFSATGLARKMFNDAGAEVAIVIEDGPTTYTSTVTLVSPNIGGATKAVGVSTVTMPSSKPVLTATT